MRFAPIDLSEFPPEREIGLRKIQRYSRFAVMLYRSDLWMHSHRMLWMIEELAPTLKKHLPELDIDKCRVLALVHDDAEMITGDIQAGHKALMNKKQLARIDKDEEIAAKKLAAKYPKKIAGYSYEKLLLDALYKNSLESHVVNYFDKLDAYCESLHEFWAGNISFIRSVLFYSRTIPLFGKKYPKLQSFFEDKTSPLTFIEDRLPSKTIFPRAYRRLIPHTKASIKKPTEFPVYDAWKRVVLERGGKEALDWLIMQREYIMSK
jgi:5'-deoxynucleotidase YfbR-like HD superfamily hydrolase